MARRTKNLVSQTIWRKRAIAAGVIASNTIPCFRRLLVSAINERNTNRKALIRYGVIGSILKGMIPFRRREFGENIEWIARLLLFRIVSANTRIHSVVADVSIAVS